MAGPYDIGGNWQPLSPSFAYFQVLATAPVSVSTGRSYFDTSVGTIGVYANGQWNYLSGGGGGGLVSSVFGRIGAVTAQIGDYTFAQIGSKPTTVSGYGITDAITGGGSTTQYIRGDGTKATFPTVISSFTNDSGYLTSSSSLAWANITGKPNTTQFMWVVGGNNNFAGLPGSPTAPIAGATTLVTSILTGLQVRVLRGGFQLPNMDPGDGTMYYTKVTASNTLTFSTALVSGELIIVETLPL